MTSKIQIADPNYVTDDAVYFYTPRYYAFDNFSAFAIEIWGHVFPTGEHAYQWKKYSVSDPMLATEILQARSAYETKKSLMPIKVLLIQYGMLIKQASCTRS